MSRKKLEEKYNIKIIKRYHDGKDRYFIEGLEWIDRSFETVKEIEYFLKERLDLIG